MANPNKTVANARRKMGGFPAHEQTEARKAESARFSEMMRWAIKQEGQNFSSIEQVEAAFAAAMSQAEARQ